MTSRPTPPWEQNADGTARDNAPTPAQLAANTANTADAHHIEEHREKPKFTAAALALAEEYGIAEFDIPCTGAKGSITKGDVNRYYKEVEAAQAQEHEARIVPPASTPANNTPPPNDNERYTPSAEREVLYTDDPALLALIEKWREAKEYLQQIQYIIDAERIARAEVIAAFFPIPDEGTNKCLLPGDWLLKASCPLQRKVDEAALANMAVELRDAGVSVGAVIDWKPYVRTGFYRSLTEEQQIILDTALVVKPGSQSLELLPPKVEGA